MTTDRVEAEVEAWLELLSGDRAGHRRHLAAPVTVVGSDPESDVCLPGPGIAPRHFAVERTDVARYRVRALDDDTATYLNGFEVTEYDLVPGDFLQAGATQLRFEIAATGGDPATEREPGAGQRAAAGDAGLSRSDAASRSEIRRVTR